MFSSARSLVVFYYCFSILPQYVFSKGLTLELNPKNYLTVREWDKMSLRCTIVNWSLNEPAPLFFTRGNIRNLDEAERHEEEFKRNKGLKIIQISSSTIELRIDSFERADHGTYGCWLRSSPSVKGVQIAVVFKEITRVWEDTINIKVKENDLVELPCAIAPRSAKDDILWTFNNRTIDYQRNSRLFRRMSNILRISKIPAHYHGIFTCRFKSREKKAMRIFEFNVKVLSPARIDYITPDLNIIVNQPVEIFCNATGYPPPTITWKRIRKLSDYVTSDMFVRSKGGHIFYKSIERNQAGQYTCEAKNEYNEKKEEKKVNVVVLIPPMVNMKKIVTTSERASLNISCDASGDPDPRVVWEMPDGRKLHVKAPGKKTTDGRFAVQSNLFLISELHIEDIRKEDAGNYSCTASNAAGIKKNYTTVVVEYEPRIIEGHPNSQKAWPQTIRNFTCLASGKPSPKLFWQKNGYEIHDNSTFSVVKKLEKDGVVRSTLHITIKGRESWYYGSYTCFAKNNLKKVQRTFRLSEADIPPKPKKIQSHRSKKNGCIKFIVELEKEEIDDLKVTAIQVEYKEPNKNGRKLSKLFKVNKKESKHEIRFCKLKSMPAGKRYTFQFLAQNIVGFSKPKRMKFSPANNFPGDSPEVGLRNDEVPGDDNGGAGFKEKYPRGGASSEDNRSNNSGEKSGLISYVAGVCVSIVVVALTLISVIIYRYKSKNRSTYARRRQDEKGSEELMLAVRRKDSPLPDVVRAKESAANSPLPKREIETPVPSRAERAWQAMLVSRQQRDSAISKELGSPSMGAEFPPPPDYVLVENPYGTASRRQQINRIDPVDISYNAVLEGYLSDDTLSEDPYSIKRRV